MFEISRARDVKQSRIVNLIFMTWFFIALISPALWALTNYIDKYLVDTFFKQKTVGALVLFSALVGFLIFPIILIFKPDVLNAGLLDVSLVILSGFIYVFALMPYLHALKMDEASVVVPIFQIIPFFSYILGYIFLNERLSAIQIGGSLLIIFGAVIISLDFGKEKICFKGKILMLMLLSSLLYALNIFIFKFIAIKESFWTTSFWEYVGFSMAAVLILIVIKSYREQFVSTLKHNSSSMIGLNIFNELLNIGAKIIFNFATLLAPLALVWTVNGFQPFFVFIFGFLITLMFPAFVKEKIEKKFIFQKIFAILVMFLGGWLINK